MELNTFPTHQAICILSISCKLNGPDLRNWIRGFHSALPASAIQVAASRKSSWRCLWQEVPGSLGPCWRKTPTWHGSCDSLCRGGAGAFVLCQLSRPPRFPHLTCSKAAACSMSDQRLFRATDRGASLAGWAAGLARAHTRTVGRREEEGPPSSGIHRPWCFARVFRRRGGVSKLERCLLAQGWRYTQSLLGWDGRKFRRGRATAPTLPSLQLPGFIDCKAPSGEKVQPRRLDWKSRVAVSTHRPCGICHLFRINHSRLLRVVRTFLYLILVRFQSSFASPLPNPRASVHPFWTQSCWVWPSHCRC